MDILAESPHVFKALLVSKKRRAPEYFIFSSLNDSQAVLHGLGGGGGLHPFLKKGIARKTRSDRKSENLLHW
jgi:hypothetical protein